MKKRLLMIVIGLGFLILLTSCGKTILEEKKEPVPTKTPSEVAQLYIDAIMGNGEPLSAYNELQKGFAGEMETYKQSIADSMTAGLSEEGVTPENINLLKQAILERNKNVEIKVVSEVITGDTATVTLSVKGINLDGMETVLNERIINDVNAGLIEYNLDDASLMNTIMRYMTESITTAPLVAEGIPIEVDFRKSDNLWVMNSTDYKSIMDAFIKIPDMV